MIRITGLDRLQRDLDTASRALKALDGNITSLKFDPQDPRSVDAAIRQMEEAIDRKIAPYRGNTIVENLAKEMKASYRERIKQEAAEASPQAG